MIKTSRIILVTSLILIGVWIGGCNLGQSTQETGTQSTSSPLNAPSVDVSETPSASDKSYMPLVAQPPTNSELAAKLEGLPLEQFFEDSYRELLLRDPELILEVGLTKAYGVEDVRLTDISDEYIRETYQVIATILEMLRGYQRDSLTPEQQVTYDVYEWYLDDLLRGQEFMYYDYPVTFFTTGVQVQLIQFFTDIHPVANLQDAQDYITRLSQVNTKFEQLIEGLKLREQAGVISPRFIVQWSLPDIRSIANSSAIYTPFYSAFKEKVDALDGLSTDQKQTLLDGARDAIDASVIPAYQALMEYLEYLEKVAPESDGIWQFPGGDAYYTYLLRHYTTTDLTADQIHELGLQETARIQAEMRVIFDELGYPADESLPESFARLARDSEIISGDQAVGTYEELIEQASQNLGSAFDIFPEQAVIVIGGPMGDYYVPGSVDGSRPGAFYANTTDSEPRFNLPTLAYHEAIPGHHFQIAIALELDLLSLRNGVRFTAYTEGWALYAERLAWELGWYADDPHGNLGRLQGEVFRAVRLVVDTGIHAKGWTFDQAYDYMLENTGLNPRMVEGQIARYVAWPGQAVSYKMGMLKLLELRQTAMDQLGGQFDLKEFHRIVLGNGSMPFSVMERVVQDYIASK